MNSFSSKSLLVYWIGLCDLGLLADFAVTVYYFLKSGAFLFVPIGVIVFGTVAGVAVLCIFVSERFGRRKKM